MNNKAHKYAATVLTLFVTLAVNAEVYDLPLPGNDVIGAITVVPARAEDTLHGETRIRAVGRPKAARRVY